MENKLYTKTAKGVAIAVNVICMAMLAVSLIVGAVLLNVCGGDLSVISKHQKYEKSDMFKEKMEFAAHSDVNDYLWQREYFETDGELDLSKYMDIMTFTGNSYQRAADQASLEYKVGELRNWHYSSEFQNIWDYYGDDFYSFYYESYYYDEEAVDEERAAEYTYEVTDTGDRTETAAVETDLGDTDTSSSEPEQTYSDTHTRRFTSEGSLILPGGEVFREQYEPNGYASLYDYSQKNDVPLEVCYEALYHALGQIERSIGWYQDSLEILDPENTNLRYIAKENGSVVATNIPDGEKSKTSISAVTEINGYEIETYVNMEYPVQDQYLEASNSYNRFAGRVNWIIAGLILGLIGVLVSILYLTIAAGHVSGKEGISLCWVDKPKLELALFIWGWLAALAVLAVCGAAIWYCESLLRVYYLNTVEEHISFLLVILATMAGDALFITGYLSLVRRIKAGILGKNSYCHLLVNMSKTILHGIKVSAKLMALFAIYLLFTLACVLIGGGFGFFLALILNVLAGWVIAKDAIARQKIMEGLEKISDGELNYKINLDDMNILHLDMAEQINQVGSGLEAAVEQSLKNERTKTDLITNVSHDIKTPLTSIINYVDLLKREKIQDEKIKGYIDILDQKSQRLKHLTEDLVEASKISSGNVTLELTRMDFNEILQQALGEFEERFEKRGLKVIVTKPESSMVIEADGRRIWRIVENLFQNVVKYAMHDTRVYVELTQTGRNMAFTVKNISENPLNISAEELTERFIRGDVSRSTEGSGLGLSIARDLTVLQKGQFDIYLDGDLFKVTVTFGLIA